MAAAQLNRVIQGPSAIAGCVNPTAEIQEMDVPMAFSVIDGPASAAVGTWVAGIWAAECKAGTNAETTAPAQTVRSAGPEGVTVFVDPIAGQQT